MSHIYSRLFGVGYDGWLICHLIGWIRQSFYFKIGKSQMLVKKKVCHVKLQRIEMRQLSCTNIAKRYLMPLLSHLWYQVDNFHSIYDVEILLNVTLLCVFVNNYSVVSEMKESPCGTGIKWSCLYADSTTRKLVPWLHAAWWGLWGGITSDVGTEGVKLMIRVGSG